MLLREELLQKKVLRMCECCSEWVAVYMSVRSDYGNGIFLKL